MFVCFRMLFRADLFRRSALAALVGLLFAVFSIGQTPQTRRLAGQIIDPQGTTVANAHVTLTPRGGSMVPVRETNSDTAGRFSFADVSFGDCTLTAEISSFAPVTIDIVAAGKN